MGTFISARFAAGSWTQALTRLKRPQSLLDVGSTPFITVLALIAEL